MRTIRILQLLILTVLCLEGCAHVPDSGLQNREFTAIHSDSRYDDLGVADPDQLGAKACEVRYGQSFAYEGPFEAGSVVFVRGVWFPRSQLASRDAVNLSPAVVAYFNGSPPVLDRKKPENLFIHGIIKVGETEYCQLITLRVTWKIYRSNLPSAGPNAVKFMTPHVEVFGTSAVLDRYNFGDRTWDQHDHLCIQLTAAHPGTTEEETVVGRFPVEAPDVLAKGNSYDSTKKELVPAFDKTFQIQSPWFNNAPLTSYNLKVDVLERK